MLKQSHKILPAVESSLVKALKHQDMNPIINPNLSRTMIVDLRPSGKMLRGSFLGLAMSQLCKIQLQYFEWFIGPISTYSTVWRLQLFNQNMYSIYWYWYGIYCPYSPLCESIAGTRTSMAPWPKKTISAPAFFWTGTIISQWVLKSQWYCTTRISPSS